MWSCKDGRTKSVLKCPHHTTLALVYNGDGHYCPPILGFSCLKTTEEKIGKKGKKARLYNLRNPPEEVRINQIDLLLTEDTGIVAVTGEPALCAADPSAGAPSTPATVFLRCHHTSSNLHRSASPRQNLYHWVRGLNQQCRDAVFWIVS